MKLSPEFEKHLRSCFTSVAIDTAVNPNLQRQISEYLVGSHDPITRDRVAEVIGAEAADRWDDLKAAIAAFRDASQ